MSVESFNLPGPWLAAYEAILDMIITGNVNPALEELPTGPCSDRGVERYARMVCASNPRSNLGIAYGLASVATCVATQGGIRLDCPLVGGGWLKVPAIQHFIGVAPSGWRKSTALNIAQEPLQRALSTGVSWRQDLTKQLMLQAISETERENDQTQGWVLNRKQFAEVYNGAVCQSTIVKDPTMESLRNMAVMQGGCVAALAGEADVFRNVSAYSKDPGSLTFFLDLWDQSSIATARVGTGMLEMDDAALWLGVLFQTDVFAEVTSSSGGRGGAGAADNFISRGMFGRIWVVAATETGGFSDIAATYADTTTYADAHDGRGFTGPDGQISPLGAALANYESNLTALVDRTNGYRMYKALHHGWARVAGKASEEIQVPKIEQIEQEVLHLADRDAEVAYNRVQRLYNALEHALSELDEDAKIQNGPLVSRFVQHVMREALTIALSSGTSLITAEIITDAATRILPWRWALSTRALLDRTRDRIEDIVMSSAWENPKAEDRTLHGRVKQILGKLSLENASDDGWTAEEVVLRFLASVPKKGHTGMTRTVYTILQDLAADSNRTGVTAEFSAVPGSLTGDVQARYKIAAWAMPSNI